MDEGLFKPAKSFSDEIRRKAFHLLSLLYLVAFIFMGYPRVIFWMSLWTASLFLLEIMRLKWPPLNQTLFRLFSGMARMEETKKISGAFHTALGILLLFFFFGKNLPLVKAGVFYAAFGDAAAALIGKRWGKHKILSGSKSWEGTFACFLVCLFIGLWLGFGFFASLITALTGAVIEFLPTTVYFNDNLWMPLATVWVLRLLGSLTA